MALVRKSSTAQFAMAIRLLAQQLPVHNSLGRARLDTADRQVMSRGDV